MNTPAHAVIALATLDLPLHYDDAHRHFMPFSDWRFESQVSYWDPRRGGALGAALELLALVGASAVLWVRGAGRSQRVALALLCALYALGYTGSICHGFWDRVQRRGPVCR